MLLKELIAASAAVLLLSGTSFGVDVSAQEANQILEDDASTEADTLIYSVRLRLNNGRSLWTGELNRNWNANPVKLRLLVEPSCRSPYVNMYLRSATDGVWQKTTTNGDVDTHTLSSFNGVRFEIENPYLLTVTCEFRLYGASDNGGDPDWGPGVLSGGAEYTGGFVQNVEVNVSASERIKGFRLAVPEFCQGVEILEAGTVTEGNYDPAAQIDRSKNIFQVASGSVRAAKVRFSVNGPFDARCFIPLYTYSAN